MPQHSTREQALTFICETSPEKVGKGGKRGSHFASVPLVDIGPLVVSSLPSGSISGMGRLPDSAQ